MWTAVYMIEGKEEAEKLKDKLNNEGFLVKIEQFSKEVDCITYKILAPEFEADEIHNYILDISL